MDAARPVATLTEEAVLLGRLAVPVALASLGSMALGVEDVIMVGPLGEEALAAVSVGQTVCFSLIVVLMGFGAGLDPYFSQAFGARRPEQAGRALTGGAGWLLALSVPVMAAHVLAGPVLRASGQPPEVMDQVEPYLLVRMLAVLPFAGALLLRQVLQARGQVLPGALAVLAANVVNVVTNAVLINGLWGAPALGVAGAAWATVASTVVMFLVVALLGWETWGLVLPRREVVGEASRDLALLRAYGWAGLPTMLQLALESWGFSFATLMAGWLGSTALAANAVALTLASLAFMVPLGFSAAGSARVGNLIGAGAAWGRAAWVAVGAGVVSMTLSGSLFAVFPRQLAGAFTSEEAVLLLAVQILPVAAGFGFFDGAQVVLFGVLRGAGDTAVPAAANVVGYYLIGLPLAAWLAFGMGYGLLGLWIGLAVALGCVAVLLLGRLVTTLRAGGRRVGAPPAAGSVAVG